MVKHRGIVSYEPPPWWLPLLPPFLGVGAVVMWLAGNRIEAAAGGGATIVSLIVFLTGERQTVQDAQRAAEPFQRLGFVPLDDQKRREMLLAAARKAGEEGSGWVVLLRGVRGDLEIAVTLQSADAHATKREIKQSTTTTLETRVAATPTPFRIGPPLGIGFRPIERGLRAPLSGFADASLEETWFMYTGAAATAETLLPPDILREPWREERWSCGGGVLRVSWHGGLPAGRDVGEALARLVRAVDHANAVAKEFGAPVRERQRIAQ